jgi:hypothetical protein
LEIETYYCLKLGDRNILLTASSLEIETYYCLKLGDRNILLPQAWG